MTNVQFLHNPDEYDDIYALFPDEYWDIDKKFLTCYQRVGQHGPIHPDYVAQSESVCPEAYQPLLEELIRIGYDDLNILN